MQIDFIEKLSWAFWYYAKEAYEINLFMASLFTQLDIETLWHSRLIREKMTSFKHEEGFDIFLSSECILEH